MIISKFVWPIIYLNVIELCSGFKSISLTHSLCVLLPVLFLQDLNALTLGDMTGADVLVDEGGEEDVHISDSESDLVSLASDLDEDDLAEIEEKEKQLKKLPKKKYVALSSTQSSFWYKFSLQPDT